MGNPLSDLITRGESGTDGYNAYNRGAYMDADGHKHIRGPGGKIDFSTMTLGEVMDSQHLPSADSNRLFAVGRYQIIPQTMDTAAASLNLDRAENFTHELQERIFSDYLIVDKRPAIHDYIVGKPGATLVNAQHELSLEWASIADPYNNGASHYPSPNRASISLEETADALNEMRTAHRLDIAKGMQPEAAWAAVTHSTPDPTHTRTEPILEQTAHNASVKTMQTELAALGYTDDRGRPLKADGDFGLQTRHAVERFQHDHHLTVDGKVGPQTQQALHTALKERDTTLSFDDAHHPDHALFEQALVGVRKLDTRQGRTAGQHSLNLAASLTVQAKREGLSRIDRVLLSDDATRTFAAQDSSSLMEPSKVAVVDTERAVHTAMAQSSALAVTPQPAPPRGLPATSEHVPLQSTYFGL